MGYKPTAEDFEGINDSGSYKPSADDFEEENASPKNENDSKKGLLGVASDTSDLASNLMQFGFDIPNKFQKVRDNFSDNPGRAVLHDAGQLGASVGGLAKSLINTPSDLSNYLIDKDLHPAQSFIPEERNEKPKSLEEIFEKSVKSGSKNFIKELSNHLLKSIIKSSPHIPEDTGIEKALGLEPDKEKGDDLIRAIPGALMLTNLLRTGWRGLNQTALKEELANVEGNLNNAVEKLDLTKEQTKLLSDALHESFAEKFGGEMGTPTPSRQRSEIHKKNYTIKKLEPKARLTDESLAHMEPEEVESLATTNVNEAHKQLSQALGDTEKNLRQGGLKGKKMVLEDKKAANNLYGEARAHYDKSNVGVTNTREIKETKKLLEQLRAEDELAPGYGSGAPSEKALEMQIQALEGETVPARDLFDMARTLDKRASKARDLQFKAGKDEELRKHYSTLADNYQSKSRDLMKTLEETGDQEARNKITQANKLWSNYSSLKNHPAGRELLYGGRLTPSFMTALNSDRTGAAYMRELTERNPEIKHHIIGSKFSKKGRHGELLEPSEHVESYIKDLPDEIQKRIENLKEAKGNAPHLKELAESMKNKASIVKLEEENKFHQEAERELDKQIAEEEKDGKDVKQLKQKKAAIKEKIDNRKHKIKILQDQALKFSGMKYLFNIIK